MKKKVEKKEEKVKQFLVIKRISFDEEYGEIIVDLAKLNNLYFVRILSNKGSCGWVATFGNCGERLENDDLTNHYISFSSFDEYLDFFKEERGEVLSWKLALDKNEIDSYKKEFNQFYFKARELQKALLNERGIELEFEY